MQNICLEISYETFVKPVQCNFKVVELTRERADQLDILAEKICSAKFQEYKFDKGSLKKRIQTGLYGEAALEEMLGVDIIDWEVGHSSEFNVGDLLKSGVNCGVKTVEYWKFPIIHVDPVRPEVIILRHGLRFLICGLYTQDVMKLYSTRDFILDPNVRASKTAFYGIPFYKSFDSLERLSVLCGRAAGALIPT